MTFEFKMGDIIAYIGDTRKFLVIGVATQFGRRACYILRQYEPDMDYLTKEQEWLDKSTCDGNFVVVGTYDFQNKKEFAEREGGNV